MEDENSGSDVTRLVIDNGSSTCRAGFSGDEFPHSVFPSVVGTTKQQVELGQRDSFVGDDAQAKRCLLHLNYPIEHGVIVNWDSMDKLWHHVFCNLLRVGAEDRHVLLSEPPLNPKENREKMAEVMFENFGTRALYIAVQSVLSLYQSGRTTGIVIDAGDTVSHICPIYEGYVLPHATSSALHGGRDVTSQLVTFLDDERVGWENARDIKEKLCFVVVDFEEEMRKDLKPLHENYELPDGTMITLGSERFRCTELFFNSSQHEGVHSTCYNSIMKCEMDIRPRELFSNIVLSGGSTMLRGFSDRLQKELAHLSPTSTSIKITTPSHRELSAWQGASFLSSLSTFEQLSVSKEEYNEHGSSVVQRKFM